MPNVALIKDDGLPLILPAGSITAILSTVRAPNTDHPDSRCVIFASFKGSSVFFLEQTAKDVFAEVSPKLNGESPWIELPILEDCQYIIPGSITGAEGVRDEATKDIFLRVFFDRHDGAKIYADVNPGLIDNIINLTTTEKE